MPTRNPDSCFAAAILYGIVQQGNGMHLEVHFL
jgi:hypothetical protein